MKAFATLIKNIDATNKTTAKVEALKNYFEESDSQSKLWAIALMSHRRPKRPVNTTVLREWAAEQSGIPLWLFEDTYHVVGDLAETIAGVLPDSAGEKEISLTSVIAGIIELQDKDDLQKKAFITDMWRDLDRTERFVFNKILTGGFRIGVSQKLMTRGLSLATGIDENILAHRIMGNWDPVKTTFEKIVLEGSGEDDLSKPYPFYLAYPLETEPGELGEPTDWSAERKWDGIRGQVIVRKGRLFVWSRGEELVTEKYPEFESFTEILPDGTVLDGEILPYEDGRPLPFQLLQTRIGRKNLSRKMLEKAPVVFMSYDLLEENGKDIRDLPFIERRQKLEKLIANSLSTENLLLSPLVEFKDWKTLHTERDRSRKLMTEGLMLKSKNSSYEVGRKKGNWWKWKTDPLTIDAVLTYAMRGHGRRANLFTDYTFGVWDGNQLVTFAKAYSGLTDTEMREVDRFVKSNTLERFGPVRQVTPELVFEIAFEGIGYSSRHKSGIAVRFPRIHRWRRDKKIEEANTIEDLRNLIPG